MEYKYAYLIGVLVTLLPLWTFLFLRRKDLRKEILTVSTVIGLLGPFTEFLYLRDYWRPEAISSYPFSIEAFLFGFFLSGISVSIYEEVFGKRLKKVRKSRHVKFAFVFLVLFPLIVLPLILLLGMNSIYATVIGLLIIAAIVILVRRDLAEASLMSGLFTGLAMFGGYLVFLFLFPEAIERWWFLENISGILILGIPVEELLWAFSVGLALGPMYEFLLGYRFAPYRPKKQS